MNKQKTFLSKWFNFCGELALKLRLYGLYIRWMNKSANYDPEGKLWKTLEDIDIDYEKIK